MKRILHISHTDIRYDSRILKELKALGNLDNCTVRGFGINDNEGRKHNGENLQGLRTFNVYSKKLRFLPRFIRYPLNLGESFLKITIPALKFKPTIIHCHDTLFLPIAFLIKWFCNSKLVYDAHELESNKAGQSIILSKYSYFVERIIWSSIDLLISVSPSIIEWYNKNLGDKRSVLILNSPELIPNKFLDKDYFHKKFNIPLNKKIFLYLGILGNGRGIDLYLNAFRKEGIDSHVVFMGYGLYTEKIKEVSCECLNIHYHEAVPHEQVVNISKSADVGLCLVEKVSLSDYFCLPNKLFEYAFSGLYVLCSDFPDMQSIVKEYNLGEVATLNPESVFNAIKRLEKFKSDNNQKDLFNLSWNYQAEKLIYEYNYLINQ